MSPGEIALLRAVYPALGRRGSAILLCRTPAEIHRAASQLKLRRAKLSADYIDRMGRRWLFRSTWECALARWLDARRRDWDYERCSFEVVLGDEVPRVATYTPDFWILNKDGGVELLIDVKGRRFVEQMLKIAAFQAQYPMLRLELWGHGSPMTEVFKL